MRSVASILIRFRPPHDIIPLFTAILDVGLDLATEFDGGRVLGPDEISRSCLVLKH